MSQPPRPYRHRPFPKLNWVLLIVLVGLLGYLIVDRYRAGQEPEYADVVVATEPAPREREAAYVVEPRPTVEPAYVDEPDPTPGPATDSYIVIPEAYTAADYARTYDRYLDYTVDMEGEMGLGHEFTHAALSYLANAAIALAWENGLGDREDIQEGVARIRYYADGITLDPTATNHADLIRAAALEITDLLRRIDQLTLNTQFVDEVTDLRAEAAAIDPDTLTLEQKTDVRSFLRAARRAISVMRNAT